MFSCDSHVNETQASALGEHTVIIDEAAQCAEPETLIPLQYKSQRIILVGDPMQLEATVISPEAAEGGLRQSLFARMFDRLKELNRVFTLTYQVRREF
jgi:superfamily I DNA and/or RNA helicase